MLVPCCSESSISSISLLTSSEFGSNEAVNDEVDGGIQESEVANEQVCDPSSACNVVGTVPSIAVYNLRDGIYFIQRESCLGNAE